MAVGGSNGAALSSTQLYDPSTGVWTETGNLIGGTTYGARMFAPAVLLNNGLALTMGGDNNGADSVTTISSSQIYDPATGTWTETGNLTKAIREPIATLLNRVGINQTGCGR